MRRRTISEEAVHLASASFYDVLLGEETWQTAMERVLPLTFGRTLHLFFRDTKHKIIENLGVAGHVAAEAVDTYSNYYYNIDPRGEHIANHPTGVLLPCHKYCDDHYVRHSEIFQDFVIPYELRHTVGASVAKRGSISAVLGIMRPERSGPYTDYECQRLQPLIQHLGRAIQLHWHLQGLERKLFAQAKALDALNFGVVVCNDHGHVYHANLEAEQILKRVVVIKIIQNRLSCGLAFDQARLNQLLHSVTQQGISNGLRLRDVATQQEWHLWAVPARDGLGFASEPLAVMVITNPNRPPSLDMILQRVFDFTFTEVKLVSALAAGVTVAEYAQRERISMATARTHVRSILGKAGVRRQTDLLRMIASAGLIAVKS